MCTHLGVALEGTSSDISWILICWNLISFEPRICSVGSPRGFRSLMPLSTGVKRGPATSWNISMPLLMSRYVATATMGLTSVQ